MAAGALQSRKAVACLAGSPASESWVVGVFRCYKCQCTHLLPAQALALLQAAHASFWRLRGCSPRPLPVFLSPDNGVTQQEKKGRALTWFLEARIKCILGDPCRGLVSGQHPFHPFYSFLFFYSWCSRVSRKFTGGLLGSETPSTNLLPLLRRKFPPKEKGEDIFLN